MMHAQCLPDHLNLGTHFHKRTSARARTHTDQEVGEHGARQRQIQEIQKCVTTLKAHIDSEKACL